MWDDQAAATGAWGTVAWAVDASGARPGLEYFDELTDEEASKMQALFERLAETGRINNVQHFKKLEDRQRIALWEFKRDQLRFLGAFASGRRFLIAVGVKKKRDKHRSADLDRAVRVLKEHLRREPNGGYR